jgi:hypothetical protein
MILRGMEASARGFQELAEHNLGLSVGVGFHVNFSENIIPTRGTADLHYQHWNIGSTKVTEREVSPMELMLGRDPILDSIVHGFLNQSPGQTRQTVHQNVPLLSSEDSGFLHRLFRVVHSGRQEIIEAFASDTGGRTLFQLYDAENKGFEVITRQVFAAGLKLLRERPELGFGSCIAGPLRSPVNNRLEVFRVLPTGYNLLGMLSKEIRAQPNSLRESGSELFYGGGRPLMALYFPDTEQKFPISACMLINFLLHGSDSNTH